MLGTKKPYMICADDYGLSPGVNTAIEALSSSHCIDAVTAFSTFEFKPKLPSMVSLGLHFNMTTRNTTALSFRGRGLSITNTRGHFLSAPHLYIKAQLQQLDPNEIAKELHLQIERFRNLFDREPEFLDGHQHVQQYETVRTAICQAWLDEKMTGWIRSSSQVSLGPSYAARLSPFQRFYFKKILPALGQRLKRKLHDCGIPSYDHLCMGFDPPPPEPTIWIFHPGHTDTVAKQRDSGSTDREADFAFLRGHLVQTTL